MKYYLLVLLFILPNIYAKYYSQIGQDKFIYEQFFKDKKQGFFVDIGAHDGMTYSNTYFFEKELGWNGICFEPIPAIFEELQKNRKCICINSCVSAIDKGVKFIMVSGYSEMLSGMVSTYDPRHWNRLKNEIKKYGGSYEIISLPSVCFNVAMKQYQVMKIDFLSIDTEGSELEILKSIDYDLVYIYVVCVENNYNDLSIKQFMETKGFKRVAYLGCSQDEVFVNNYKI